MNTSLDTFFTVYPEDCNYMQSEGKLMVHGGSMLLKMDRLAAECARRALYGTECNGVLTVAVKDVSFEVGAVLGDIINLTATIVKVGVKSIQVEVIGYRDRLEWELKQQKYVFESYSQVITKGLFVFVSTLNGKTHAHGLKLG